MGILYVLHTACTKSVWGFRWSLSIFGNISLVWWIGTFSQYVYSTISYIWWGFFYFQVTQRFDIHVCFYELEYRNFFRSNKLQKKRKIINNYSECLYVVSFSGHWLKKKHKLVWEKEKKRKQSYSMCVYWLQRVNRLSTKVKCRPGSVDFRCCCYSWSDVCVCVYVFFSLFFSFSFLRCRHDVNHFSVVGPGERSGIAQINENESQKCKRNTITCQFREKLEIFVFTISIAIDLYDECVCEYFWLESKHLRLNLNLWQQQQP